MEFLLFGCVPGWIGLRGTLKPVEPLVVVARQEVMEGDGTAAPTGGVTRTYDGAVEVAFEAPQLTVAGSTVSLGGASSVRLATTFLDERLRIGRGGFGSLFLFERMPAGAQAAAAAPVPSSLRAVGWLLCRAALSIVFLVSTISDVIRLAGQNSGRPLTLLAASLAILGVAVTGGAALVQPVGAAIRQAALSPALAGGAHLLCVAAWLGGALTTAASADGGSEGILAATMLAGGVALLLLPATGLAMGGEGLLGASRLLRWAMGALLAHALWAQPSAERLKRFLDVSLAQQGSGGATAAIARLQSRMAGWRGRQGALTVFAIGALALHLWGLGARLV